MSTSAVVLLVNYDFASDDGGRPGYDGFIRMTGRADSGFYVHGDGYPDTLGAALLQLGQGGVFAVSSMVAMGDPTYWTGIYPAGTAPFGEGEEILDNGVIGARGIHDTEPMADFYTDYELDITTGEYFLKDRFGADYVYLVDNTGVSCISSSGDQLYAEWGDSSYSRIASKPARTAAIPGLDWKYRAGDEWGGSDWIGFVSDGSYILHAYESGEWELEDFRQNIVAYDQAADIEAAKVAVEGAYAAEVGGIQQTLGRRAADDESWVNDWIAAQAEGANSDCGLCGGTGVLQASGTVRNCDRCYPPSEPWGRGYASRLAQDDETNWDTDEIDRFIANDEILYDATEGVTDPREMEGIVQDFFGGNLGYPEQDPGVDFEVVDWDEVVMVRNSSRQAFARTASEEFPCTVCGKPADNYVFQDPEYRAAGFFLCDRCLDPATPGTSIVDQSPWNSGYTVERLSRRQAAEPAGPMTGVEDKTCEYCDDPWHGMKPCPVQGCQCAHVDGIGTSFARRATRYPEIEVELVGQDGNAFNLLGIVRKALSRGGVPQSEIDEFMEEATSGDYDHLLQTCMEWVEVY